MAPRSTLNAREPWQAQTGFAHTGPVLDRIGDYEVIDCEACGFRHVLPLPEPADCAQVYHDDYYALTKPDYLVRAAADSTWARMFYQDRLAALQAVLGVTTPRGLSLLDIGSGPGHLLDEAVSQGWHARGVEPSRQAAAYCQTRALSVHTGAFDADFARSIDTFDAIHCMNVLEHVPDPISVMTLAWQCLEPQGAVCVGVPNDYSPFQKAARKAGAAPWWLTPPHHLNYFDFESLERLLVRTGFEPVTRLTSFPMDLFCLMGRHYPGNDTLGRSLHAERKALDTAMESFDPQLRRGLYRSLAYQGLGREAIVIARKVQTHA